MSRSKSWWVVAFIYWLSHSIGLYWALAICKKSRILTSECKHTLRRYDITDRGLPLNYSSLGCIICMLEKDHHFFGWIQDEVIGLSVGAKRWNKYTWLKNRIILRTRKCSYSVRSHKLRRHGWAAELPSSLRLTHSWSFTFWVEWCIKESANLNLLLLVSPSSFLSPSLIASLSHIRGNKQICVCLHVCLPEYKRVWALEEDRPRRT